MKKSLKVSNNILLLVVLVSMVLAVWLKNLYVAIGGISLSVASIIVLIFSVDKLTFKNIFKELNLYFYIIALLINLSVALNVKVILYIGISLFVLMLILYLIAIVSDNKKSKK